MMNCFKVLVFSFYTARLLGLAFPLDNSTFNGTMLDIFNVTLNALNSANITDMINDKNTVQWLGGCRLDSASLPTEFHVICDAYDKLDNVSFIDKSIASDITSLTVQNQPRFRHLHQSDMTRFLSLVELTITNTGLSWIDFEAFANNRYLKKVSLRWNALKTLDWRSVVGLRNSKLDINDNPLVCNCSIFWLSVWKSELIQKRRFVSPDGTLFSLSIADAMTMPKEIVNGDFLQCRRAEDQPAQLLSVWRSAGIQIGATPSCSLPVVNVNPKLITVVNSTLQNEANFTCKIDSQQELDMEFRQPFQLKVVNATETKSTMSINKFIHSGQSNLTLHLSDVTQNQMGWYVCVGLSVAGPNFDMAALIVESEPNIRLLSRNRSKSLDHVKETFEFVTYSFPPLLNSTWMKNLVPIDFDGDANKLVFLSTDDESEILRKRGFFYAFRSTFVIRFRYLPDFFEGNYTLQTCNALSCTQLLFANFDRNSLPPGGSDRSIDTMTLTGHISLSDLAPGKTSHLGFTVMIVCVCALFVISVVASLLYCVRKKRRKMDRNWLRPNRFNGRNLNRRNLEPSSVQLSAYDPNSTYEPLLNVTVPLIPKSSLEIVRSLGEGAFGEVFLAYCDLGTQKETGPIAKATKRLDERSLVAAKTLKQFALDRREIAREAELMAKLDHPNIVTFYGVCLRRSEDLLLLYEYMELGDLKKFLCLHGPHQELLEVPAGESWQLVDQQLIDIALQIARGLAYLHENHFVHRDLACRNCLVKPPLTVKLSDFGMTRDVYSGDYYRLSHTAPLPVRWLSPEAVLYGRFSDYSDIWSYGVVVWEIASCGKQPWYQYSNMEVMQRVGGGEILTPAPGCPNVLSEIMLDCWKRVPSDRAKLRDIIQKLSEAY